MLGVGNNYWFIFFNLLGFWGAGVHQLFLTPVSPTLDTFDIDAVFIVFQGEVSPASLACFASD